MNSSQIHLAMTHIPVILSLTGLVILVIALIRKNYMATRISFYILIAAGLFSFPVFFSGEGAEEVIEHFPGVSGSAIERHEGLANTSLWIIIATAILALAGLFGFANKSVFRMIKLFVLFFALLSSAFMGFTAHLGGQIRHTEIRTAIAAGIVNNEAGTERRSEAGHENDNDQ
jgi:uncharacterized membrane protein